MKSLLAVLSAALLAGCVNVYERWPTTSPRIEAVYQPTRVAAMITFVGSFPQIMSDCPSESGSLCWANLLSVPFIGLPMAVDTLCEAAIDTALLPCDLILTNNRKATP